MRLNRILLTLLFVVLLASCAQKNSNFYKADNPFFRYSGRTDNSGSDGVILIGSASSVTINFSGDTCSLLLKNIDGEALYNYVSLELDGEYLGRVRTEGDSFRYYDVKIPLTQENHILKVYKATEPQNGQVVFGGLVCRQLKRVIPENTKNIEFIGNSITCGMGIEWKEIPCNSGVWFDQHNAYWTYGSQLARELNVQYMLSSVSGIGIYRNWNSNGPTMPQVYENTYLNTDSTKKWDFSSFTPDIVSICLGTNDLSDGDGTSERSSFNPEKFTGQYIRFVKTVHRHYPEARIALLSSPMLSGEKKEALENCLLRIQQNFNSAAGYAPIEVFRFDTLYVHGCDYHPDREDHRKMAESLLPFFKDLLNSKN